MSGGIDKLEIHEEQLQEPEEGGPSNGPERATRSHWPTTALVGLAMLLVGLAVGYLARPVITPEPASPTPVATAGTAVSATDPSGSNPSTETLMAAVVAQTRHFRGDPDAPVTVIEFGDFQ